MDSLSIEGKGDSQLTCPVDTVLDYFANGQLFAFSPMGLDGLRAKNPVTLFGKMIDSAGRVTPWSSPKVTFIRHREQYIFPVSNSAPFTFVDNKAGMHIGGGFRQSDHLTVWSYAEVGVTLHSPSGAWSYAITWPIFERMKVDSVWYISSLMFPFVPFTHSNSVLGGLITPDLEVQKNLTPTHKAKIIAGLDVLIASNNLGDDTTANDLTDGIVIFPKLGLHWRIGAIQLRVIGGVNLWADTNDKFRGFPGNLGPSIGVSIWSGPEYLFW